MKRTLPHDEPATPNAVIAHMKSSRGFIPLEGAILQEVRRDRFTARTQIETLESWLSCYGQKNVMVEETGWLSPKTGAPVSMFAEGGLLHYYNIVANILTKVIDQRAIFEDDDYVLFALRAPTQYRVYPLTTIKACFKWWDAV